LQGDEAVWKSVLEARYGLDVRHKVHWINHPISNRSSVWWKDLCRVDVLEAGSWFGQNIERRVGRGDDTRFWKDLWVGNSPLCERFPRLFSISLQKDVSVEEMRGSVDGMDRWLWQWRRNLFAWEHELLLELQEVVPMVVRSVEVDSWFWRPGVSGMFTVKSAYTLLGTIFGSLVDFGPNELKVLNNIWRSAAPSKVIAFSWKLLRNRIPTKVNLAVRGVLVAGGVLDCVHCVGSVEDARHLFMFCNFAYGVWSRIFRWLGVVLVMPQNLFSFFDCFVGAANNKKAAKGFALIWHTTIWLIWRSRNEVLFSNGVRDLVKVVDDVKLLSWRWGLARRSFKICLFYEWCWEPGICFC
jgi:hypothetical protein